MITQTPGNQLLNKKYTLRRTSKNITNPSKAVYRGFNYCFFVRETMLDHLEEICLDGRQNRNSLSANLETSPKSHLQNRA
jgi:hypothetical protein